jgi:hypothetical protein
MDTKDVTAQLAALMAALQRLESTLAAGDVPLGIVSEFKSSVDDLRLRLWGVLTAHDADDQLAFHQRFRMRRAREMCLQIGTELREGELPADGDELHKLVLAARALIGAAGAVER